MGNFDYYYGRFTITLDGYWSAGSDICPTNWLRWIIFTMRHLLLRCLIALKKNCFMEKNHHLAVSGVATVDTREIILSPAVLKNP